MARVLLIDDSPFQNAWMGMMLQRAGHEAVVATGGTQARQAMRQGIDVCLVELVLLQENGFELAGMEEMAVPLALMLARRLDSDRAWAQALGIRHFCYRPCGQAELEALLRELIAEGGTG